jgi:hypothetical protein
MTVNPTALAAAKELVAREGMSDFIPRTPAPASTRGSCVPLDLIDACERAPGVPLFDKPDPERPGIVRSRSILAALREGVPLPPIKLFQKHGEPQYQLRDGFHRLHLFAALGYTHVAAEVTDWNPDD